MQPRLLCQRWSLFFFSSAWKSVHPTLTPSHSVYVYIRRLIPGWSRKGEEGGVSVCTQIKYLRRFACKNTHVQARVPERYIVPPICSSWGNPLLGEARTFATNCERSVHARIATFWNFWNTLRACACARTVRPARRCENNVYSWAIATLMIRSPISGQQ